MKIIDNKYDSNYKPSQKEIENFPDIQNGPSSLIKGATVGIQQVGSHNFKLPLKYQKKSGDTIELETKVTGTVSLESHKKGINMSRIIRSFYDFKDDFIFDKLNEINFSRHKITLTMDDNTKIIFAKNNYLNDLKKFIEFHNQIIIGKGINLETFKYIDVSIPNQIIVKNKIV